MPKAWKIDYADIQSDYVPVHMGLPEAIARRNTISGISKEACGLERSILLVRFIIIARVSEGLARG